VPLAAGDYGHEVGPAIRLACTSTATFARSDASSVAITGRDNGSSNPADFDGADAGVAATF